MYAKIGFTPQPCLRSYFEVVGLRKIAELMPKWDEAEPFILSTPNNVIFKDDTSKRLKVKMDLIPRMVDRARLGQKARSQAEVKVLAKRRILDESVRRSYSPCRGCSLFPARPLHAALTWLSRRIRVLSHP